MILVVLDSGVARFVLSVVWREEMDLVALETWLGDDERRET